MGNVNSFQSFIFFVFDFLEEVRGFLYALLSNYFYVPQDLQISFSQKESLFRRYSPLTLCVGVILFMWIISYNLKIIRRLWNLVNSCDKIRLLFAKFCNKYIKGSSQLEKVKYDIKGSMNKRLNISKFKKIEFPQNSQDYKTILAKLESFAFIDKDVIDSGKITGCIYSHDSQTTHIASEAMKIFSYSNLLHPTVFTGARFIESQVIKIGIALFNGNEKCCGVTTTGGTMSIVHAMLAYRNRGYKMGITKPEIIIPITAHVSFLKAAEMFCLKVVTISLNENNYTVNEKKVAEAINENTVAIVGSFPNFPHGICDDIEALSKIAVDKNVPLHVDACLGGFLVAFYQQAGITIPKFDFSLPGVTSISADLHKYGLCPKGVSLLFYSNKEYRKHQYFFYPKFMEGIYPTPSIEGSRSPATIAAAYAVMLSFGKNTYVSQAGQIHDALCKIKKYTKDNLNLIEVIGDPQICGIAFRSPQAFVFFDQMSERGWHLNLINNPLGFSLVITCANIESIEKFIKDLQEVHDIVDKNSNIEIGEEAQLYKMAITYPEEIVRENLDIIIDSLLDDY